MKQAMFQAIASTLIYGKRDAVLVDAFMTVKQADTLVDCVAASGVRMVMKTIGLRSVLFANTSPNGKAVAPLLPKPHPQPGSNKQRY
jgi:hypothetical protein